MSFRNRNIFLGILATLIVGNPALSSANSKPARKPASELKLPVVSTLDATYEDMWSWVIADPETLSPIYEEVPISGPDHSGVEEGETDTIIKGKTETVIHPANPKGIANPILAVAKCSHDPKVIKQLVSRKLGVSSDEGSEKFQDVLFSVLTSDRFEELDSQKNVTITSAQERNEKKIKRMCSELVLAKNVKDPAKLTEKSYVELINSVMNEISLQPASGPETSYALESNQLAKQFNISSVTSSNSSYAVVSVPIKKEHREKIYLVLQDDNHKSCYLPKSVKKTGAKWARREHWSHIVTDQEDDIIRLYKCKALDPIEDELRKYTPLSEFLTTAATVGVDATANVACGQGFCAVGALLSGVVPFFLPCGDLNDKMEAGAKRAVATIVVNGLPNGGGLGKFSFLAGGRSDLGYANSVWGAFFGSAFIGCATGAINDVIQGQDNLAANCAVGAASFVAGYMIFPNIADEKFLIHGITASKFADASSDGLLGGFMANTDYQKCKADVVKKVSILTANDVRSDSLLGVLNSSRGPNSVESVKKVKNKKKK